MLDGRLGQRHQFSTKAGTLMGTHLFAIETATLPDQPGAAAALLIVRQNAGPQTRIFLLPEDDDAPQDSLPRAATLVAIKAGLEVSSDSIKSGDTICVLTTMDKAVLLGPVEDAAILASLIEDFGEIETRLAADGITLDVARADPREIPALAQAADHAAQGTSKLAEVHG
jgi:hypothetical protein